jgi:hypothetical protein
MVEYLQTREYCELTEKYRIPPTPVEGLYFSKNTSNIASLGTRTAAQRRALENGQYMYWYAEPVTDPLTSIDSTVEELNLCVLKYVL